MNKPKIEDYKGTEGMVYYEFAKALEKWGDELKAELDLLRHFCTWDVDNLKELKAKGQKFTSDNTSVNLGWDGLTLTKKP